MPAYSVPLHRGDCNECGEHVACFTSRKDHKTQVCGGCMTVEAEGQEQAAKDAIQARLERQSLAAIKRRESKERAA